MVKKERKKERSLKLQQKSFGLPVSPEVHRSK
jgi:hypothetical protein